MRQLSYLLNCGTLQIHLEKNEESQIVKIPAMANLAPSLRPKRAKLIVHYVRIIMTKPNITLLSTFQLNLACPLNLASPLLT